MKELKRSRTNAVIAGVCGGIGEYLEIDPNVIRLIWVVVTVFTVGVGVIAYLLAWLIVPEEALPAASTGPSGTAPVSAAPGPGTIVEIEPDQDR
jgi:phage shock protein C